MHSNKKHYTTANYPEKSIHPHYSIPNEITTDNIVPIIPAKNEKTRYKSTYVFMIRRKQPTINKITNINKLHLIFFNKMPAIGFEPILRKKLNQFLKLTRLPKFRHANFYLLKSSFF